MNPIYHYTDKSGHAGISCQPTWRFLAGEPPALHQEVGAYFTSKPPSTPKLAAKLRISREKLAYFFSFDEAGALRRRELKRVHGGRGDYIFYSPTDYAVLPERQISHGQNPHLEL